MINDSILDTMKTASQTVGTTWPLYSFVTSNPLSGYEQDHFLEAIQKAQGQLGARVLPSASQFRQALQHGEIDRKLLIPLLAKQGRVESPEYYLDELEGILSQRSLQQQHANHDLDRIMVKWLSIFMDEGLAEWEMPFREKGFYAAWRELAKYDKELYVKSTTEIPQEPLEALNQVLYRFCESKSPAGDNEQLDIFKQHLAALPGWTGYIKHRVESNSAWQQKFPISLIDYLAMRLWIADHLDLEIYREENGKKEALSTHLLEYAWLTAWEKSWQNNLIQKLKQPEKETHRTEGETSPEAQLVFCIDTRSEAIRRHVESSGDYETFGYAGFFGIAMDYTSLDDGLSRKSCPPIVTSAYEVNEVAQRNGQNQLAKYEKLNTTKKFATYFLGRMKNMLPSAFGYVEGSGVIYGFLLLARTLFPGQLYKTKSYNAQSTEGCCTPEIAPKHDENAASGINLEERTAIVKSAFDLLGWREFAPLVLFVGHGSHSANNPFGSSLDCGACAASPGRHNARILAKMANDPKVRNALKSQFAIAIPEDTVFLGAEHNTTTDEIVLFDSELPTTHEKRMNRLKTNLIETQLKATRERLGTDTNSVEAAYKKTNNWAETRPEWGLAKNAGFIVGPRSLTQHMNLDGNCFLHSYNWELDEHGTALESIMQGPMVVTQWINNHYYFSTVDNKRFGGGSKITHNVTGRFGVVQGNGGDLKMGLPLQSINATDETMYHRPLRLTVMIQAPCERVQSILIKNKNLQSLLDNEWIYLLVMDPTKKNDIMRYEKGIQWASTLSLPVDRDAKKVYEGQV